MHLLAGAVDLAAQLGLVGAALALGELPIDTTLQDVRLYIADEVFLTGTAAEITPVRSVDKITVGEGKRGPITERLQKLFFGLFDGSTVDRWGWLEPIVESKAGRVDRPMAV